MNMHLGGGRGSNFKQEREIYLKHGDMKHFIERLKNSMVWKIKVGYGLRNENRTC